MLEVEDRILYCPIIIAVTIGRGPIHRRYLSIRAGLLLFAVFDGGLLRLWMQNPRGLFWERYLPYLA
jgi:hypothetical protein